MSTAGEPIIDIADSLEARVAALLLAIVHDLPDADALPDAWYSKHRDRELTLESLQVIQLVDLIEATFDIALSSLDVVRVHFASPAALVTRLRQRGAA